MATEFVVPVFDGDQQPNENVLESIKSQLGDWKRPLPTLQYKVELPITRNPFEGPSISCRETVEEFGEVVSVFGTEINNLFTTLAFCQNKDTEAVPEHTRYLSSGGVFLDIRVQRQSIDHPLKCHHRTYHSRRLVLRRDSSALPQLPCVTRLRILSEPNYSGGDGVASHRPVSLRVPLELLLHLPAVRRLECPWAWEHLPIAYPTEPMRHYSRPWEGPWRDARHDFERATQEIDDQIPASLTMARFFFYPGTTNDEDQSQQMPNLIHPAEIDPLSVGLRRFASHLEELDLRAILTPDIFTAEHEVPWSRMKRLRVEFHPMRSDGSWYFVGPKGEDPYPEGGFQIRDGEHYPPLVKTDEDARIDEKHIDWREEWYEDTERHADMFRIEPSVDRIEPFLVAFAKRLKATPSIEEAELFAFLGWCPSEARRAGYQEGKEDGDEDEDEDEEQEYMYRWGVKYTSATKNDQKSNASVEWQVGSWRPSSDVLELFENLGADGGGVDVAWKEFERAEFRPMDDTSAIYD